MMRSDRWLGRFALSCAIANAAWVVQPMPAAADPSPPQPGVQPAPAPAEATSSTDRETPDERAARRSGRTWGWIVLGGVGAPAGLVAIGTSVAMLIDNSTRNSNCNAAKVCSPTGFTANSDLATLSGWNAAAWGLAAVGLGLGAYLVLTHHADRATETQVGVAPNGSGASFTLRTSF
ncbi:MAG: hypothetical protein WBY94_06695 [Polyangiaceae bacterium]